MFESQLSFVAPSLLAGAVAFGAIAASSSVPALGPTVETAAEDKTIASTAVASGRLDTLVAAVQFAGLVDALTGEGPFTVFAPTDAAFSRLDSSTLESLLTEAGRPTLQRILMHHVVAGSFEAADLVGRDSIETLAGTTLELDAVRGRLLVSDAVVESADVDAGNGVVHLI
ncbi:MAG: fasciclin domain-containing protein, partial [Planctomycetota bacterium]|nr:fasciclin domain-containing protein [Planctomycetota bacterium]